MSTKRVRRDEVLDSRDILERIEDLEGRQGLSGDEVREWQELQKLVEDAGESPDWKYGEQLIRDDCFVEYARELAYDTGLVDIGKPAWPYDFIDWERAAEALKSDYFSVEFLGAVYWIRG